MKKAKYLRKCLIANKLQPNKPEKLLRRLLNKCLPNEYKFVGNGKVILGGFNPDFINVNGKKKNYVKYVANAVVDGIAGYGNPLGVPVIAGDVYFNSSFDDNCLCCWYPRNTSGLWQRILPM